MLLVVLLCVCVLYCCDLFLLYDRFLDLQNECMYVCMYVRMYVCMCVCVCMYVCMYVCMCRAHWGMGLILHQAKPRWTRREEDSKSSVLDLCLGMRS